MKSILCHIFPCWALAIAVWLLWAAGGLAATYQVGATRTYHAVGSLPALNPGDSVEIDPGTYSEVKRWTAAGTAAQPITVRGVGASRPVFDAAGLNVDGAMPHPRAVFQVEADYLVLENLEFRNARNGNNGAGIRVTSANNVTVRNCRITACDMGVMSDNNSNLVIEASEIASNGTSQYDGYSHNLYLGGNSATIRFCYIHDALYGQNFKTRAHYTELLYNYVADSQDGEVGLVDAVVTASPNSHAVMIGNIIVSKPRLSRHGRRRPQRLEKLGAVHRYRARHFLRNRGRERPGFRQPCQPRRAPDRRFGMPEPGIECAPVFGWRRRCTLRPAQA
ncbi:MAG: right-handed parallel beta-helix repeat-containing protein [Verrucomicrobia bacterium]|nr:right-handed parallel beta-helix repeat-containing protein [Verrucomicrobiota bacterium]